MHLNKITKQFPEKIFQIPLEMLLTSKNATPDRRFCFVFYNFIFEFEITDRFFVINLIDVEI